MFRLFTFVVDNTFFVENRRAYLEEVESSCMKEIGLKEFMGSNIDNKFFNELDFCKTPLEILLNLFLREWGIFCPFSIARLKYFVGYHFV